MSVRCGIGYDLHRLAEGRKLIVGGIEVPFDKGPVGHSDGDVLAHAMCDALLGAAGLGDIGKLFPDTDPKWKDANSLVFLEHTRGLLGGKNFVIEYVDAGAALSENARCSCPRIGCFHRSNLSQSQDQRRRRRRRAGRSDCCACGRDTFSTMIMP